MDELWQDIESAPRDGSWIQAKSSQSGFAVLVKADAEDGFWEDDTGDYWVEARYNPNGPHGLTHWMPLTARQSRRPMRR